VKDTADNIVNFPGYLRKEGGGMVYAMRTYAHPRDLIDVLSPLELHRSVQWELRRFPEVARQYATGK
jgi:hypothetical protein